MSKIRLAPVLEANNSSYLRFFVLILLNLLLYLHNSNALQLLIFCFLCRF